MSNRKADRRAAPGAVRRPSVVAGAFLLVLSLAAVAAFAGGRERARWSDFGQREIRDHVVFSAPSGGTGRGCALSVDGFAGSVVVTPGTAGRIEFVARERIRARDAAAAERARQEVRLEVEKRAHGLSLYVDGPFRCDDWEGSGRSNGCRHWQRSDYVVIHDFELRVPAKCDLDLSTVNDGGVRATGIEGSVRARAVNGPIHLQQMKGEIDAVTVNDDVRAEMSAAPSGPVRLETVNGDAELSVPGLDADLELETMNGEMFSDFPFSSGPASAARVEKRAGKSVIRIDDGVVIRVGSPRADSPRHRMKTLNGDVLIRRTKP